MIESKTLKEFLRPTYYCDSNNAEIQRLAKRYYSNFLDSKYRAIKIFEFVRDQIKYHVGPWGKKASETLQEGFGMCTNSTNLLVALLRASDIPAGYCIFRVIGGESFGHILPNIIKRHIDRDSVHIVACVYLEKWVLCDPSTDSELSEKTKHLSNITHLIRWDGEHDSVHYMSPVHIISRSDPLSNIDYQLSKKPRFIVKHHVFTVGNAFIDFLRNFGHELHNTEDLNNRFEGWLKRKKTHHYFISNISYIILSLKRRIKRRKTKNGIYKWLLSHKIKF